MVGGELINFELYYEELNKPTRKVFLMGTPYYKSKTYRAWQSIKRGRVLTDLEIKQIKQLRRQKMSIKSLGKMFHVHYSKISSLV